MKSKSGNTCTSLNDVHTGDHVAICLYVDGRWTLATVTGETEITITVNGKKFMRSTGYESGVNTDDFTANYNRIRPLSESINRKANETFADAT